MDRLPDEFLRPDPEATEKDETCKKHGVFRSSHLWGRIWSKCPTCADEHTRAEEAEARERARLVAEDHHRRMLDAAAIPARFIGRSFANFVADSKEKRHALTVARDFAENFAEHKRKGSGLILAGKPGTGKSHLAGAVLQTVLTPHVRYVTCMDLIRAVRDTWRRDSEKTELQLLGYFERLDLLVIDEVGVQYGTDGEQNIVFDVLDRRYREVKPTILLTNKNTAGFKQSVGERTFDRLTETCRWVPFDWESYRPTARKESF